jgi:intracellular septation protein A
MWKIVVVLVLTALAILMARVASHAPLFDSRIGTAVSLDSIALQAPLMYAGVRG